LSGWDHCKLIIYQFGCHTLTPFPFKLQALFTTINIARVIHWKHNTQAKKRQKHEKKYVLLLLKQW
jgi:hypothetical protein